MRTQRVTSLSILSQKDSPCSGGWPLFICIARHTPESALERHLRWSAGPVTYLSQQSPLPSSEKPASWSSRYPHSLQLGALGDVVRTGQQSSQLRSMASPITTTRLFKIRTSFPRHDSRNANCWKNSAPSSSVTSLWEQGTIVFASQAPTPQTVWGTIVY